MKKFLASVFILAVFSSVVFYIGWTQFRVKPDFTGVVVSKTSGISKKPVENGVFSWYWQFLLPTNAELKTYSIEPVNVNKVVKGQLPSGDVYTAMYNSPDTFSYYFDFSISVTVSPEAIIDLLLNNKISGNDDLKEYLDKSADVVAQLAADYCLKKASENSSFRPESVRRDDLLRNIQLYNDCPEVDITIFSIVESKIPDYSLYRKLQSSYLSGTINDFKYQIENTRTEKILENSSNEADYDKTDIVDSE